MIARVLELVEPIDVDLVDAYGRVEGGLCWWASLRGSCGHRAVICLDDRIGSPTRHCLFEGARFPHLDGAVLVELGSEEEGVVVPLLSSWVDEQIGRTRFAREEERFMWFRDALLHLGDPA